MNQTIQSPPDPETIPLPEQPIIPENKTTSEIQVAQIGNIKIFKLEVEDIPELEEEFIYFYDEDDSEDEEEWEETPDTQRIISTNHQTVVLTLNDLHKSPVLSSVSPINGSRHDHPFFTCHLCAFTGCGDEQNQSPKSHGFYPIIKNLGAKVGHLRKYHCKKNYQMKQLMSKLAQNYLNLIEKDIWDVAKTKTTITKSSSESCVYASWKTNQPEISASVQATEDYCSKEDYCMGHAKEVHKSGVIYTLDLANSVYCLCSPLTTQNTEKKPILVQDVDLVMAPDPTFYKQAKRAFIKTHRTLLRMPTIKYLQPSLILFYRARRVTRNQGVPPIHWITGRHLLHSIQIETPKKKD